MGAKLQNGYLDVYFLLINAVNFSNLICLLQMHEMPNYGKLV